MLQVLQTAGLLASQMSYTLEIPISRARGGREDRKQASASPTAQVRGGGRGREEGEPPSIPSIISQGQSCKNLGCGHMIM